jgi:hypothetical protein
MAGTSFADFIRSCVVGSLLYQRAVVSADLPPAPEANTLAQEEAQGGGRAWLSLVSCFELIDWIAGDGDQLRGAVLHQVVPYRPSMEDKPDQIVERFRLWTMREDGRAWWSEYETPPRGLEDNKPGPDSEVHEKVPPTPTTFRQLPVQVLELPHALWAGSKAGPLCEEHFRRRSELAGALARSLVEIPYVKRGPEIGAVHGALPSTTQQNPERGRDPVGQTLAKGWVEIGSEDEIGFASPTGRGYELARQEKQEVREEIFAVVHAMAMSLPNSAAALQRSGESKREDRQATALVLDALGTQVRGFAVRLYETIAGARGEQIRWTAHGLDAYDRDDRETLVVEATDVQLLEIPSPTFRRSYTKRVALALLPDASAADKAAISREIDQAAGELEHAHPDLEDDKPSGDLEGDLDTPPGRLPTD